MRIFTSADAKNNFGELIDLARAAPVAVTKYDRPVVVVVAVEEFERLGVEELKPIENGYLQRWAVSKRVNSSKADSNDPTLIDAVKRA